MLLDGGGAFLLEKTIVISNIYAQFCLLVICHGLLVLFAWVRGFSYSASLNKVGVSAGANRRRWLVSMIIGVMQGRSDSRVLPHRDDDAILGISRVTVFSS
jgi:hypothetical protein